MKRSLFQKVSRMKPWALTLTMVCFVVGPADGLRAQDSESAPSDRPDFTGTYDIATLTPLQRPERFGNNLDLTLAEAKRIEEAERQRAANPDNEGGGAGRTAPPVGGDGSAGAEGNVGGYNSFWTDRGTDVFSVDGKFRTSIIVDPPNGRRPALTAEFKRQQEERRPRQINNGTAWWLGGKGPGPYDDPELRPLAERCVLGFGSTAGPPMLPVLYNNLKRLVLTSDYLLILNEMVHDVRIIPIREKETALARGSGEVKYWLGDSVGYWEGDALVVLTSSFREQPSLYYATGGLQVTETFRRMNDEDLLYQFTVQDPNVWEGPWEGEVVFPGVQQRVYEYACHEGNYALGNILRGARLLEADAEE